MPRIPNYDAAGVSVARTNTPHAPRDNSAAIRSEGQAALLGAVTGIVDKAVEHDDKLRYSAARSALFKEQSAIRKELEADNDYASFDKRYTERMAKARSDAAANIRGARSRELFEADAQADIDRGAEQIRGLARGKEVKQGIASLNANLEDARTQALESKDPVERGRIIENALGGIDAAYENGYIEAPDRQATREKFRTGYAEAFVKIQTPAERISLLESPEQNVAKYIAPDRRKALLDDAKKDNDEVRVRGESQAIFDKLIGEYGDDFKGALSEARRELKGDPLLRDATESRLAQEQARVKTFELEDRQDAGEEALKFINDGGKFADLPKSLRNRLTPSGLNAIRAYAEQGTRTVTDPETLIELSSLAAQDQQRFGDLDLLSYRSKLTASDFEEFVDLQRKIQSGVLDGKATGFQSRAQIRDAKLRELFGTAAAKDDKKTQAKINDFVIKYEQRLKAFKEENGKAATTEDVRKILDDMTVEVATGRFFGKDKRAYELTQEDVDVPEDWRTEIISELRSQGKPVTLDEIKRLYLKNRPAPSTTPIHDALTELEKRAAKERAKK